MHMHIANMSSLNGTALAPYLDLTATRRKRSCFLQGFSKLPTFCIWIN